MKILNVKVRHIRHTNDQRLDITPNIQYVVNLLKIKTFEYNNFWTILDRTYVRFNLSLFRHFNNPTTKFFQNQNLIYFVDKFRARNNYKKDCFFRTSYSNHCDRLIFILCPKYVWTIYILSNLYELFEKIIIALLNQERIICLICFFFFLNKTTVYSDDLFRGFTLLAYLFESTDVC